MITSQAPGSRRRCSGRRDRPFDPRTTTAARQTARLRHHRQRSYSGSARGFARRQCRNPASHEGSQGKHFYSLVRIASASRHGWRAGREFAKDGTGSMMSCERSLTSRNGSPKKKHSVWLLRGRQATVMERRDLSHDGGLQVEAQISWKRSKAPLSISYSGCGSR